MLKQNISEHKNTPIYSHNVRSKHTYAQYLVNKRGLCITDKFLEFSKRAKSHNIWGTIALQALIQSFH